MLARARAAAGHVAVRFRQHDLHEPLPFAGGTFDRVVSGLVLEHLRDLRPFFAEIRRVLAPGGHAVVSTIHPALRLREVQAGFTDPRTGQVVRVDGGPQEFSQIVLAALAADLRITHLSEHGPDAAFAARVPRAEKYVGWPLLLLLRVAR